MMVMAAFPKLAATKRARNRPPLKRRAGFAAQGNSVTPGPLPRSLSHARAAGARPRTSHRAHGRGSDGGARGSRPDLDGPRSRNAPLHAALAHLAEVVDRRRVFAVSER